MEVEVEAGYPFELRKVSLASLASRRRPTMCHDLFEETVLTSIGDDDGDHMH